MKSVMACALTILPLLSLGVAAAERPSGCGETGVWLQVLGSGGPELGDGRASSSYLLWVDGHARALVDAGGGSVLNFERSGARFADLEVLLFSHFHVDHSADLPAYVKASYFLDRQTDLPLYGPSGNRLMPDTAHFVTALLGEPDGAFRYLSDFLAAARPDGYRVTSHVIDTARHAVQTGYTGPLLRTRAIPVHHGPIPALAWRLEVAGKVLVFSGDMNGDYHTLPLLAQGADLLVAHNAVPEGATGVARALHMPPSVIGEIAAQAKVRQVVLSHRMLRTLGLEQATRDHIRQHYPGPVRFANDLDCFRP